MDYLFHASIFATLRSSGCVYTNISREVQEAVEEDWAVWFLPIFFVQSEDFFDVTPNFAQVVKCAIQIGESYSSGTRNCARG